MARTAAGSGLRIEYGLIAAGIAVAIIAAVNGLGSQVKATFGS
jgi:pilus assembly protein Flp/PilA